MSGLDSIPMALQERINLSDLEDTLLPKLMIGEVRVEPSIEQSTGVK